MIQTPSVQMLGVFVFVGSSGQLKNAGIGNRGGSELVRFNRYNTLPEMNTKTLSSLQVPSLTTVGRCTLAVCCILSLQACAVVAVADAAVTVVATGVKVTAKAVGAVADTVIPD